MDTATRTQHTPGPWEYDNSGKYYAPRMIRNNGQLVAQVLEARGKQFDGSAIVPERTEANARLIASAPDLLTALEELTECVREAGRGDYPDQIRNEWWMKLLTRCEAAIAAARGTDA